MSVSLEWLQQSIGSVIVSFLYASLICIPICKYRHTYIHTLLIHAYQPSSIPGRMVFILRKELCQNIFPNMMFAESRFKRKSVYNHLANLSVFRDLFAVITNVQ